MPEFWQKWQKQIETLLAQQEQPQKPPATSEFVRENDFSRLQIPSVEEVADPLERMIILFSRMSACYEYGLFLEQIDSGPNYQLHFGFDHGQVFRFTNDTFIKLPKPVPNKIQKLKNQDWFKRWNLKGLADLKDATHLLLYPWPNTAMILSTRLADPWLKMHIEKTLDYLRNN